MFLRLLARNAIGTPMTQYTSHFRAPRAGAEMHYVLVDNGRSERLGLKEFWTSLKCIRCGACMNTCPVYRRSGGLSYGATYSGPIGLILDPTMNRKRYSSLPFSSTLNGSCTNVCPVKINIHEQIFAWRKVMAEEHRLPLVKAEMMKALGQLLAHPALYRAAVGAADVALRWLPHFVVANPLNTWSSCRSTRSPTWRSTSSCCSSPRRSSAGCRMPTTPPEFHEARYAVFHTGRRRRATSKAC